MARTRRAATHRTGKALLVYVNDELADSIETLASQRRVTKSELVRTALNLLVDQLNNGQLRLPLGIPGNEL